MRLRKYTLQQLEDAIKNSLTISQCLKKLNVVAAGGNYAIFHKAIKYYNLDTSHFTGRGSNVGRKFPPRRKELSYYLQDGTEIISWTLKRYLIEAGLLVWVCSECHKTEWNGGKIPLELDHINGKRKDNRFENLRLLCPNCHALTPTYRAKNRLVRKKGVEPLIP